MRGLLRSPPFVLVYLCSSVGPPGATRRSACLVLLHSESGPLVLSVGECGAAGSASGKTACPVRPTLRQSQCHHGNVSPLCPSCPSTPLLPVWMNVYFLFPWCWTSLPFDFLSVLVVGGGAVCLPTPPSWFSTDCQEFQSFTRHSEDLELSVTLQKSDVTVRILFHGVEGALASCSMGIYCERHTLLMKVLWENKNTVFLEYIGPKCNLSGVVSP